MLFTVGGEGSFTLTMSDVLNFELPMVTDRVALTLQGDGSGQIWEVEGGTVTVADGATVGTDSSIATLLAETVSWAGATRCATASASSPFWSTACFSARLNWAGSLTHRATLGSGPHP